MSKLTLNELKLTKCGEDMATGRPVYVYKKLLKIKKDPLLWKHLSMYFAPVCEFDYVEVVAPVIKEITFDPYECIRIVKAYLSSNL